jgi:Leucine-rich repeat (LRR) protein
VFSFFRLNLTGNCLSQFTNAQHLTKLKRLILSKNTISHLSLQGLHSLEYLSLSHNRIEHLPDMSDLKKLIYLDLSHNRLLSTWRELICQVFCCWCCRPPPLFSWIEFVPNPPIIN